MSLQERIFGLETEYAVNFYPANPLAVPGPPFLVQALQESMRRRCGITGTDFLMNGGKFHHDIGHAEWAIPECRSAREAVTFDKAIDHLMAQAIPEVQQSLAQRGADGLLFVAKNNVDSAQNTYGCHENYLMLRDTELLVGDEFRRYMSRCLVPFLVTRQIFTGAGRLLPKGLNMLEFTLSQRAPFIETIVSNDTRVDRSIINFGRENEPLAVGNYRRLHLILGDSNLSGWATWIKLGITAIVLRMIEDLFINDIPLFRDPVDALHTISRDPTCSILLQLRNGDRMSARDIQWRYYEIADAYMAKFQYSAEESNLMDAWEEALIDLEKPVQLRNRVDWAMKKHILDSYLEQERVPWYNLRKKSIIDELQARDLRYHDISPDGLFNRLNYPDTLLKEAEIQRACVTPPQYTRARLRGTAITQARQLNSPVTVKFWMEMSVGGKPISLLNPLEFDHTAFAFDKTWWEDTIKHEDYLLRTQAVKQLAWRQDPDSLSLLLDAAEHDKSEIVRRAAVEALGYRADKAAMNVLYTCLKDLSFPVRWAAEEALVLVNRGVPKAPPIVRSSEPGERESPVQILT